MNKSVVAIIPARSGSKSVKDKNIKLLGGKPLIAWSIESALKAGIERVIVDSDSEEYLDIAREYGAEGILRPESLAGDKTSTYETLKGEVPKILPQPDYIVLLQPTSPFRNSNQIKIAINYITENPEFDSLVAVEQVPEHYNPYAMILQTSGGNQMLFRKLLTWKEKVESWFTGKNFKGPNLAGFPINQRMTRRQDLPQCWLPTGSLYIFKTSNLKKGSFYGDGKVMLFEQQSELNINTLEDFERATKLLEESDANRSL